MIWHIFKKDWTLLWRFSAGVGALYFALMLALLRVGRFHGVSLAGRGYAGTEDLTLFTAASVFPLICTLASAFLITAIVQQDAIPGVRQDWLVRPIRRRDLFLAKMVGLLVMVIGPIFAADLLGALINGFAIGPAVTAALGRSLWIFLIPFLPVFALATVTRNLMEMIVGGTPVVAVWFLRGVWRSPGAEFLLNRSSVAWMDQLIHFGVVLIGAAILLTLQYRWRRTLAARLLMVGALITHVLFPGVNFQNAFALERRLSPEPGASNTIRLSFMPDRPEQEDQPVGPSSNTNQSDAYVLLPIRASGLPDDAVLNADTSTVRLITPDGQTQTLGYQMGFQLWREPARGGPTVHVIEQSGNGVKPMTYVVRIPRSIYARSADQPLSVEIDFSLTLLRVVDTQTLPASGGSGRTPGLGWCGTKLSVTGGEVLFGCIQAGAEPHCVSIVLEHTPSGARSLPDTFCRPDYSPFRRGYNPDALSRFTERLPFGSASGGDLLPIKETMLPKSQVKARLYEPQEHFIRQLVIPEIRLRDWASIAE